MLGALCGNIAGSRFLYQKPDDDSQIGGMFDPPAQCTDSGRLIIEFGQLLLKHRDEPEILRAELTSKAYPMLGMTEFSLIGRIARSELEVKQMLHALSPRDRYTSTALAMATFWAGQGETKETILQRIEDEYFEIYRPGYDLDHPRVRLLAGFFSSNDFETAIWRAVETARPSEELASAMGTLAEAYYGLSDDVERNVRRLVNQSGRKLIRRWKNQQPSIDPLSFRLLTKYLAKLNDDRERSHFVREFYHYAMNHPLIDLSQYQEILQEKGLEWTEATLRQTDAAELDSDTILALIMGSLRADHFSPGLLDDLVSDGAIDNWLKRLTQLDRQQKIEPVSDVIRFTFDMASPNGRDTIRLDENSLEVVTQLDDCVVQTMTYQLQDRYLIAMLDDVLSEVGRLIGQTDWDDTISDPDQPRYHIKAEMVDDTVWERSGQYDRAHMPESGWQAVVDQMKQLMNTLGFGRALSLDDFNRAIKPGEVKYCGVEFRDYDKIYHYLTYDMDIQVGDRVIVPTGPSNAPKEVTVRTIEFCRWDDTPYPLEETKLILGKADQEEESPLPSLVWRHEEEPPYQAVKLLI